MDLKYRKVGRGPIVVLLHPVGLSSEFWGEFETCLTDTYTCITVDLAGHGKSPDSTRPGNMDACVLDVVAVLQKIGKPVILLGVSFGGMIAMQVALLQPSLVRGLVLAACPAAIPEAGRASILDRAKVAEEGGMEAVVDSTLERWFSPKFLSSDVVKAVRDRLLKNKPSNWAATWEAVAGHDVADRLGEINVPTLVVAGEADTATPLAAKKALAHGIRDSRLAVIIGAPHMLQIENPNEFSVFVLNFISSLED